MSEHTEGYCSARIYSGDVWSRSHQCYNKAKKDGFCMMHHPDSVKARDEKRAQEYIRKQDRSPLTVAFKRIETLTLQRDKLLLIVKEVTKVGHLSIAGHEIATQIIKEVEASK